MAAMRKPKMGVPMLPQPKAPKPSAMPKPATPPASLPNLADAGANTPTYKPVGGMRRTSGGRSLHYEAATPKPRKPKY